MNNYAVLKSKNIDINTISINKNNQHSNISYYLSYNNERFLLQTPIFNDYELFNYNSKHYIDLKLNTEKLQHVQFLTFIDSLELKLNNYSNSSLKTQVITDIQNNKSIKVKLLDSTIYYDNNKNQVNILKSNKISLLLSIEYHYNYYSLCAVQILQLN